MGGLPRSPLPRQVGRAGVCQAGLRGWLFPAMWPPHLFFFSSGEPLSPISAPKHPSPLVWLRKVMTPSQHCVRLEQGSPATLP